MPVGDASPHSLTPLDPPLRVAVVRSVALIIVVGRLTVVVCQHGVNRVNPGHEKVSSVVQHSMLVGGPLNDWSQVRHAISPCPACFALPRHVPSASLTAYRLTRVLSVQSSFRDTGCV